MTLYKHMSTHINDHQIDVKSEPELNTFTSRCCGFLRHLVAARQHCRSVSMTSVTCKMVIIVKVTKQWWELEAKKTARSIFFSQGHLLSQKDNLCFVIVHDVKNNELLSDHHHINIIHTHGTNYSHWKPGVWCRAWFKPKEPQSYIRKAKTAFLLLQHLQEARSGCVYTFSYVKICCLYSFTTPPRGFRVRITRKTGKTWDDSLLSHGLPSKTCGMTHREQKPNVVPHRHFALSVRVKFILLAASQK